MQAARPPTKRKALEMLSPNLIECLIVVICVRLPAELLAEHPGDVVGFGRRET